MLPKGWNEPLKKAQSGKLMRYKEEQRRNGGYWQGYRSEGIETPKSQQRLDFQFESQIKSHKMWANAWITVKRKKHVKRKRPFRTRDHDEGEHLKGTDAAI